MAGNLFFHKYPYTDFHELNLSWVLEQVQECVDKVEEFDVRLTAAEGAIESLQSTVGSLDDRLDVLEAWKITINGQNLDSRVTAIEGSAIMDADMLVAPASVTPDATKVNVAFTTADYTDGAKTTGTDSFDIPQATTSLSGVMIPGDKSKLNKLSFSGDDLTLPGDLTVGDITSSGGASFSGAVAAGSPSGAGDLTTKSYVDSLAISGSATVSLSIAANTVHWQEGLTQVDYDSFKLYTYGKVAQARAWIQHVLDSDRSAGAAMFTIHIPEQYAGDLYENITAFNDDDKTVIPCRLQGLASDPVGSGTVNMTIIPLINVAQGTKVVIYFGSTYLITA